MYAERKTYCHEWRRVDTTHGRYLSAARIWKEEGGTSDDVIPAQKHIEKCVKMGFPFTKWNSWTDRYDYLWFEHAWEESLTKSWALYQEWRSKAGQASEGTPSPSDKTEKPGATSLIKFHKYVHALLVIHVCIPVSSRMSFHSLPIGTRPPAIQTGARRGVGVNAGQSPQSGSTHPRGSNAGKPGLETGSDPKPRSEQQNKAILNEAIKTKSCFFRCTSAAESIRRSMKEDSSWSWVSPQATEKFNSLVEEIVRMEEHNFTRKFHTHEVSDMKRMYELPKLLSECEAYNKRLHNKLAELDAESKKLAKMHLASKGED